jgi:hypothetical protein
MTEKSFVGKLQNPEPKSLEELVKIVMSKLPQRKDLRSIHGTGIIYNMREEYAMLLVRDADSRGMILHDFENAESDLEEVYQNSKNYASREITKCVKEDIKIMRDAIKELKREYFGRATRAK